MVRGVGFAPTSRSPNDMHICCWNDPLKEFGRFEVIRKLSTYTMPKQLGSRLSILWLSEHSILERVTGFEPVPSAWKAAMLAIKHHTRNAIGSTAGLSVQ